MHNVICLFNNESQIDSNNIISLKIEQDNNNVLKANIVIPKLLYNHLLSNNNNFNCQILIDNNKYFDGNIASIQINSNLCNINLINKNLTIQSTTNEDNILERFKINNPSLFQKRNILNTHDNETIYNIENSIINDSLKVNIDKLLPIHELNLFVSASWNKSCTGYCDITNKINNKLNNGVIGTLTPKKLIKSWPKLFDRLVTNNKAVLKTKYFVTYSKLEECNSNIINVCNDQISLNETYFKCKLSIGWEYSQFVTENLHCKIINDNVTHNNSQVLNINLHNVQEYVEDIYINSFFQSKIGNSIFNIVLDEVKQFVTNSMQNITVQFQIPFSNFVTEIKVNKFVKIHNHMIAINKIEILFENNMELVTITGIGSEYNNAFDNVVPSNIQIENNVQPGDDIINILENIEILNTSDEQIKKINSIQFDNDNQKEVINNILNNNPTQLLITLNPIKTEHNKIENIYVNDIKLYNK